MGAFEDLVDALGAQFDETQAELVRIVNIRERKMISDAEWRVSEMSFGSTVANQSDYTLPANVVDIRDLEVAGERYGRTSHETLRDLQRGDGSLGGYAGAYALSGSVAGVRQFEIHPTPTTVVPITAWGSISGATRAYGNNALVIPEDFWGELEAGCRADAYRKVDDRPDLAQAEIAEYLDGVEKLKRLGRKQFGGPASRVKVAGYDYS